LGARIAALDALLRPRRLLVNGKVVVAERQIVLFDPTGVGRVAEVFGDLSTAHRVAILVPGTGTKLNNWSGVSRNASSIHELALENDAATATIAYLGFEEPPTILEASRRRYAERAVEPMIAFADGLRLDPAVRVTVVGHSYGTTAVGMAVGSGLHADNVVLLASPGIGVDRVDDLGASNTKFYALRNPRDPIQIVQPLKDGANHGVPAIPIIGAYADWFLERREGGHDVGFGPDPVAMEGVTRLATGKELDEEDITAIRTDDHSEYFSRSRRSASNIAAVVTDRPARSYAEERARVMSERQYPHVTAPGLPSPSPQAPPVVPR
jgi:pimeloyl-ACP methyl ester carboxylesterase